MTQPLMSTRPIPNTGEALPVVGCGTYVGFDRQPGSQEYAALPQVLRSVLLSGGRVLDTSPMYGRAETTLGELLAAQPAAVPPLFSHEGSDSRTEATWSSTTSC